MLRLQEYNGRELVVPLHAVVEAVCVFKNGTRRQQLELLFRLIDVDASRTVTAMELFGFISLMTQRLKRQQETDPDLVPDDPEDAEVKGTEGMSIVSKVQFLFKRLDDDGSGGVNIEEFVEGIAGDDEMWGLFNSLNPFTTMMRVRSLTSITHAQPE